MKVLHIITRLDAGGSAYNTIVSVDRLREHGHETSLAYGVTKDPDGAVSKRINAMGVPLYFLEDLVRDVAPLKDLKTLRELRSIIRRGKFDLVHTHTSKGGVLGRMAAAREGVPTIHTPHGHIFYGYFGALLTRAFVLIERRMARTTRKIVSLTDIETRESLERGIGNPEQYVTIHSGVPLDRFRSKDPECRSRYRASLRIPDDALVFVSVGRLTGIKGHDMLIEAFAQASLKENAFLVIVGEGEEEEKLVAKAAALDIKDRVRFTGKLGDVRPALCAADVFALMSRNEGMGRAFIEAMAAGLPVAGPDVGGVPSIIKDDETGLLVKQNDVSSMAQALERLSAPSLREQLGTAGADFVYPEYDETTMIEQLAQLYSQVGSTP